MRAINLHTELNALGIRFEPIGYVKAPSYPYGIYTDDVSVTQPDTTTDVRIISHHVEIEIYDRDMSDMLDSETIVETWLNGIPINYSKIVAYVIDEDHYSATYTLNYTTKERDD